MSGIRLGLGAALISLLATTVTAVPANAGDVAAPTAKSPVGDWGTSTNGVKQTLTLTKDGKVSGSAGCNRFIGEYTVHGSDISFGPLATTLMACEESVMAAEATFLTRLGAAVSYRATKKRLWVAAPKDVIRFVGQ